MSINDSVHPESLDKGLNCLTGDPELEPESEPETEPEPETEASSAAFSAEVEDVLSWMND